jgi:hypothetical protein
MRPETASPQRSAGHPAKAPRSQPSQSPQVLLKSRRSLWFGIGFALLLLVLLLKIGGPGKKALARRVRYVPVTRNIASGSVTVKPRDGVQYRVEITPDMRDAQVIGSFTAYGGSTNGVSAVLMGQSEYDNWIGGHRASAFYSSEGQKSTDHLAVRLGPGSYFFGISNRLSKTASKLVYLDLDLVYYRSETY